MQVECGVCCKCTADMAFSYKPLYVGICMSICVGANELCDS